MVYQVPVEGVTVTRDIPYGAAGYRDLTLDIYSPIAAREEASTPAVLFVTGYADDGLRRVLGCFAKEMGSYVPWARLMAAHGVTAITTPHAGPGGRSD